MVSGTILIDKSGGQNKNHSNVKEKWESLIPRKLRMINNAKFQLITS